MTIKSLKYIPILFIVLTLPLTACGRKTPESVEECTETLEVGMKKNFWLFTSWVK
ncbi:MAG: hypothetical protein JXA25_01570 [Anaerolineales bacterium]|nr:hypothetical protein [Anaerolineales bacterium]